MEKTTVQVPITDNFAMNAASAGLSRLETVVLALWCEGDTDGEVARRLRLPRRRVYHSRRIAIAKLYLWRKREAEALVEMSANRLNPSDASPDRGPEDKDLLETAPLRAKVLTAHDLAEPIRQVLDAT